MQYLLYGANGYTAQLIIKDSLAKGLKPILAGRNKQKIEALATKHNLPFRVFGLENEATIIENLKDVAICLNAAGPFSKTALPMALACIKAKVHYLDITGEIEVFETVKSLSKQAIESGIMLMPGVGFDVVPSDCLANYLKEKMPEAQELELAFTSVGGGISHGTASTMLENIGEKSAVRKDGKLKLVAPFHKSKRIDFGDFSRHMATIPWGDISTAYTSTGIPNIEVYTSVPKSAVKNMKWVAFFNPILKTNFVKKIGQWYIDKNLTGPTEKQNIEGRSYLQGIVKKGEATKQARLICAEGYLLTALCSVHIIKKVLEGSFTKGYQTPAMTYGWEIITEIPNTTIIDL